MPDQKAYYIEVEGQDPIVVGEEKFNTGKDDFYRDYPDAHVSEVTAYKHGETELDPSDSVSVNVDGQDPITLPVDRFLKGADDFYRDYPDARVMRIRPSGTWGDNIRKQMSHEALVAKATGADQEWRDAGKAQEQAAKIKSELDAARQQLEDFDKKSSSELAAIPGQQQRVMKQGEQAKSRGELQKQIRDLEEKYYNSNAVLQQRQYGKDAASTANEELDKMIAPELEERKAREAKRSPFLVSGSYGVGGNAVIPSYNESLYTAARNLNEDTYRLYDAPSKYGNENGFNNFLKGARDRASQEDFWSMGLTGIVDQMQLKGVFDKIREKLGGMTELTEENIDETLSPMEKQLLAAFFRNADAQASRAEDMSRGYQAGQSATDSLQFMAQFALAGGVSGGITKALSNGSVESMSKWIAKSIGKEGSNLAAKAFGRLAGDVAESAVNMIFQPGTVKSILQAQNQLDENGEIVDQTKAFWRGFGDYLIENVSERSGDYIGNVLGAVGKATGAGKLLDKAAQTEFGKWGRAFYNSDQIKMLRAGGWHGFFGEISEEYIGDALRSLTNVDSEAWKNAWTGDNIAVLAMSFLPMSIFGGAVNTAKYGYTKKQYGDNRADFGERLAGLKFSDEQIAHALDLGRYESPEAIRETMQPLGIEMLKRGATKQDMEAAVKYMESAAKMNAYDGYEGEKVRQDREAALGELTGTYGDFWQGDNKTGRIVERVTLPDGKSGFVQDTDETGIMTVKWDDGSVSFTDAEHGAETETSSLDQYLDSMILMTKGAQEAASMQEEEMQARQAMAEKIAANEAVPMGTEEAPVDGTYIGRDQQGMNIIETPDGQVTLSDDDLAAKWGLNLHPQTQAQKDADAVAEYDAAISRRDAYNTIPRGTEIEAHLEGLDQPVKYNFTHALFDEEDQEVKIYVEDQQTGEEIPLPESAFPDLAQAAAQYSQRREDVSADVEAQREAAVMGEDAPAETQRDFRGDPLPLKEDGSVNQTELWNKDPEAWAAWNDDQRRDGGVNSRNYVQAAANTVQAEIDAARKQYDSELDFDKREAIEKQIAEKTKRLDGLNRVLEGYNAREEAAKRAEEEAARKTPEQAAAEAAEEAARVEAERQKPLEERARAWEERTGQKVTVIHNFDEIPDSEVTARASIRLGLNVNGWYSTSQGHVMLYLPNIPNEAEVDKTYMHEVVSHKGLREMLGEERFNELMDHTWNDIMSEADRKRFTDYVKLTWPDAKDEALRRSAADEYIADLAENIDTNPTAWAKFVAKVKEILEKILGTELKITDDDLKTLLQASLARYEELAKEGNQEARARLTDSGIASNVEEVRFSVKYAPKSEEEAGRIVSDIVTQTGVSEEEAKRWVESETSLADIIGTKENQPYLDYTGDDRYAAIKENSDYPQGTVDFNNICRKRLAFTDMYQRIQKAFPNVIITGEDLANIRNIMKSHGLTVACGLCYVEDRRQLLGEIAKDFIDNYNGNFDEYASRGGEAKKKNADKFRKLIGEDRKDDLSIYDLITLSGSAKLYEEHPGIYNAFQAFNNARGQQSGNLFQGYAEYKREILKWSKKKVENVNNNGGLRVFSYSDFEAHHLIDLVQIIQDCARKGVKIQGYTKVPAFARAVANTGIKLNRSLIPLGDTGIVDGRLAYDPVEGIDVNDPNFLESNDNVGNILIGINDQQIRLAMADPFVHYIIPYHSNQREVLRSLKQTGAWTNYKPYQNEKDASGKTTLINIYTEVLAAAEAEGNPIKTERQFTEKFLAVCKEKGLTPRFEQFLDRVGGEYVYTPGYYKLLLDFKMFDEQGNYLPQNPVVAQFDDAFNAEILNDYVKGEKEKFDGNLDEVYNEIVAALGLEGREQDVQPKTGDQILGEILESIDRKNAGQDEAQTENESEEMLFRKGDPSTEEGNTFFRISDGTLVGLHNISEDKLRKADKAGGLANPSAAVIDITKQEHNNFGEISLVMPSAMVSATSGKNGGTYLGDAWTPTFPGTQKKMSKAGAKAFDKQIMALPADVRYNVENAFENYLEEDRDGNALRWWFLNETGRNPAIIHHESPYSEEDAKTIEGISEWELKDEDIRTLADLYRKYASEEDVRKATTKFEPSENAAEFVRKRMREYNEEIDKYGIRVAPVEGFLRQAKDQIRQDGRLDDYRTMDSARQFIEDNNLGEEFRSWLESKEEEFGVETKLFAGWDRNGYKKWIDYTAENASKLMNKESGRNAYSDNGLSATHALLVRKMRTLAEIRKNKDLLVTRAEYDERYDQVDKELHSAISVLDGMQKISDNPFTNYDYTASRLQEALTHTNPVAYLNSAYKYTIPEDGEYAQQLEKLRKDIMEMPVNYFETKFNRPVGLSEFTSAVVPSNLDEKTRKILEDAGVTMFEYDPNQEGSRRDATMRATEQEGIRFRVANENQRIFVSNAEKAVEEMKMDKATPEQWKKTLEKNGGLKAAEDKWLGLSTWLDGLDRKTVTKQEILDFIAENQIKIEEQRYSENVDLMREATEDVRNTIGRGKELEELQAEIDELVSSEEYQSLPDDEAKDDWLLDQMKERYGDDFELGYFIDEMQKIDYALEPWDIDEEELNSRIPVRKANSTRLAYTTEGLTNRQEIALTVPTIEPWNESDKIHFGDAGEGRAISWARFGDTWTSRAKDEAEKKYRDADKAYRDYRNEIVAKYALQATDSKKTIDLATEEDTAKVKALRDEANRLYHEWQYGQHPREKVLVIDEIQSKRHQEAREQGGYKDDSALKVAAKRQRDTYDAYNEFHRRITDKYGEDARDKMTPEENAEYQRLYREFRDAENAVSRNGFDPMADEEYRRLREEQRAHENSPEFKGLMEDWMNVEGFDARQAINEQLKPFQERNLELLNAMDERERILAEEFNATHKSQIPAAPFEKNWPELTMKRMLRYAAENGYDAVAWTTGDQQAERYNIGGILNSIERRESNNLGELEFTLNLNGYGTQYIITDEEGNVIRTIVDDFRGKNISDIVGKELAVKMLTMKENETIEGEGLRVGGEGMRGFYDDILPRFMNKYGKKWGVKVEDIYLPALGEDAAAGVQKGLTMHSVPVTAEMKESVMQGQTMFRITPEQDAEYMEAVNAGDMDKAQQMVNDAAAISMPKTKVVDENGKPMVVYHGTPDMGFTVFAQPGEGFQGLIWMTDQKRYADVYAEEYDGEGYPNEGAGVYSLFANIENPLDMGYIEDVVGSDAWNSLAEKLGMTPEELFDRLKRIDNFTYEDAQKRMMYIYDYTRDAKFANLLKEKGFDGAFALEEGINKTPTYAAVDPAQVKSAEPVEYDDQGKVIPLSERFNPGNKDIRFRFDENNTNFVDNGKGSERNQTADRENGSGVSEDKAERVSLRRDRSDIQVLEPEPYAIRRYDSGDGESDLQRRIAREQESQRLIETAKKNGLYIDPDKWYTFGVHKPGNTMESEIYADIDNGRYVKFKDPFASESMTRNDPSDAIYQHLIHNIFFPEARYKFIGISEKNGDVRIVLAQDFVNSDRGATTEQSKSYLTNRGFSAVNDYKFENDDIVVTDLEEENLLIGDDGSYHPIDPIISNKKPAREIIDKYIGGVNSEEGGSLFRIAPEEEESVIRFRVVDDPLKIAELEAKPKVKVYRSMQEIDGKLYPPMSARVDGEMRQPTELGVWEESEENPDLADDNGNFKLDKGNGKSLKAAYAPYFHSRRSPLNEQFSEAYNRPNLVIVEGEIPESELTSGYTAEKSKKSVGEHDWPSGKVSNALAKEGQDTRKVLLSRWFKPVRVVPNSEVADMIMERVGDSDIAFPYNVVTPGLREELAKRGARFDGWQGNKPANVDEQIARMKEENDAVSDNGGDIRFSIRGINGAKNAKDEVALDNLEVAEDMERAGKDMPTIWRATGWEKGTDGKWRNEIPDAKLKESVDLGSKHKAGEILDAPELFDSYPQIADYDVYITKSSAAGGFDPNNNSITIDTDYNTAFDDGMRVLTNEGRRTLLHELQHAIQNIEGFATGGSKGAMEKRYYQEEAKKNLPLVTFAFNLSRRNSTARLLRAGRNEVIRQAENLDKSRFNKMDQEAFAELIEYLKGINDAEYASFARKAARVVSAAKKAGEEGYHNLAGEVEARNVERRSKVPAKNRKQYAPSMSEDTPRDKQIVRFRMSSGQQDGEDHRLFKLGEQGEKPAPTADQLVKRVQDYGLRGILDEDAAKAFWADAYAVMPEDARRQIVDQAFSSDSDRQELNIRRYTRQYIADLAKKGYAEDESGLLRYLADKIKAELGQDLDEDTLRYLIWRSANRYASNNILDLAEDISMRRRLHVGEFTGEKYPDEVNEAMNAASERIDEAETDREEARATTRRAARKTPYEALNRAMSAQRKYDQETVSSIVALAKDMIKKGNVDSVTAREMARLMTIIKDANGRRPATVKASANQLLDFLVDHTVSKEKELLDKIVKVRTAKVREPGVDTIAKLDLRAQNVINAFRENYKLSEAEIDNAISELEDKMADGRRTDASLEDMRSQLEGLQLAKQYAADISAKEADIKAIRQQMKDAQDEFAELTAEEKKKFRTSLNEELATGEEMIRAKKIEEVEAYRRLRGDIAGAIDEGAERAKTFLEAERERVEQIHHWANSDMQGVPTDVRDRKLTGWAKVANWPAIRLVTAPLANLDQMLRTLGRKSPEGRGYLWNWMMGAVRKASDNEKLGLDAAENKLNDKVREIFDDPKMEWNDLYALERKMPKSKMRYFSANGEWVEEDLTQGNLLYIYMVNKMADGRMKLRQMNISEEDVQEIKKALDPRLVELADWIQEEFLPGLRDRYNETHKRLFGTSMASIENYFPLRILGGVVEEKRNVGDQEGKALPSDITGAIIKRTVNSKQLNLATDALPTVIEHVKEMEQWNAYAEASRDFSTLLKYKRFQNQLKQLNTIYGAGQDLMNLFWDTVNLSVGAYRPTTTPADKAFLNIAKGVTAAKISFRAYTALKQMLSWPAFLADTNTFILAKNTLPSSWKKNWEWAMENLPNFKKRVESRKAGMDILEDTKLDSKFWGTDFAKWINQNGMFMNAFVDALTVSIGAKSVYDTRKARYLEEGFSEEEADKKAKFDAEVAYNETQQSSEKEFMSTMQANRTVLNVALSAYRNSSMGYQRQLHQALRTLGRMSRKGYKQDSIEYMTKQLTREGLSEADAEKAAKARYARAGYQAAIRVAVFGWLVQFAWNLGSHAAYLLFGDDPDEKKAMLMEDAGHALVGGGIEGLAAGNVMSDLLNMVRNKENLRNWDPTTLPIMSDIKSTISHMSSDPVAAWNDLVYLGAQIGLGTNPQTLSDAIVAIVDAANGDFETAREVMLCIMRILAVPQSQLDQIMIDEIGMKAKDARELTYEDVAKRYVDYKMMRNAPVTGEVLGGYESERNDGLRAKREKSLKTTFKKKYNERKNLKGEE